jgi:hypothetical protein
MMKVARTEDQQARRKWMKRQNIEHSYGNDIDDDNDEPEESDLITENNLTVISGKSCRCVSKDHNSTSHRSCPLNKNCLSTPSP